MEPSKYPLDAELRVNNLMGEVLVLREVVVALLAAVPNGPGVIALALQRIQPRLDLALNTELPDSVLKAADLQVKNLKVLAAELRERDSPLG